MAAPTCKMVARPLRQLFTHISGTGAHRTVCRKLSLTVPGASLLRSKEAVTPSQWQLHGAVCLQRLPVISQDRHPIEDEFAKLMHQIELEKSLLSDHELRLLEDAERASRKQEEDYDSDEEEDSGGQEIITAQDMEDTWEQKLKQFHPAARFTEAAEMDTSSVDRCLRDSLVLLVKKQVGNKELWLLPQLQWEAGETLRQTAERALTSLPGADFKASFLGNTPCGVYKYKFPKDIRTEACVGAKVFFFKALLSSCDLSQTQKGAFMWVKKGELQQYLKPEYLKQVNRFVMSI
ncbi:39S ribosomal protein L46, mitochondrial [Megalops cyprinoides]|uniref:39S ribosomal protein L46, mitochondrial n=1 Tax=Megalops cyprinoides TaxID=118141 RepID=UPI001863DCB6|nr:39S ribosomal protein L46, mitochondrial [Megalops cyprinoides]